MKKKIIVIWDLDGFIGVVNSTSPYNFGFDYLEKELQCVKESLAFLEKHHVKTTFAITGFSAEEGLYPYVFPDLIKQIADQGHEVASHSWRHEWIPLFSKKQIGKSLARSKKMLETRVADPNFKLTGFVPPHNKPSSWIARGAISIEDKGLFPFFEMGDTPSLIKLLKQENYKWVRTTFNPFINRFFKKEITYKQKIFKHNDILVLENHYTGFDSKIIDYIETKNQEYFVVSAHPVMLSFKDGRPESWENFEKFILHFTNRDDVEFLKPMDLLDSFGIR
jgi:peptidoglycan/xylan/chitin deacetylase (PgdA/CDA1 family)